MKKTILKSALLAIASVGFLASTSSAVLIEGNIGFSNSDNDYVTAVDAGLNVVGLDVATGFVFVDGDLDGFNAEVNLADGDFSGLIGTSANFSDGQFNPFVNPTHIWTAGNYSFELNAMQIDAQSQYGILIVGSGTATAPGFDPTPGYFSYSTQAGEGTWSAASDVPEPGTLLIFGTGLIGLAGYRRQKSKKA